MLKTSDPATDKAAIPRRLEALRAELKNQGLDGFIVPRQDEFQGEYVAAYADRLRWLMGRCHHHARQSRHFRRRALYAPACRTGGYLALHTSSSHRRAAA